MMNKLEKTDDAIEKFAAKTGDESVVFSQIYDWVSDYLNNPDLDETQLEMQLTTSHWFFEKEFEFDGNMHFIHRKKFFKGKQFLISPTEWEIEKGILIPGHRFLGLLNPNIFPIDVSLSYKTPILMKKVYISLPYATTTLLFLGQAQGAAYLIADDESNKSILLTEPNNDQTKQPEEVSVSAFDLKEFYNKNNFKTGDRLLLTIEDWETGKYTIKSSIGAEKPTKDTKQWGKALKSALLDVFELYGLEINADNQLALAYFHSSEDNDFDLMKNPAMTFSSVFNKAQDHWLSLQDYYGMAFLWYKGKDIRKDFAELEMSGLGNIDESYDNELDEIIADIGLSSSKDEITAYILDALSKKEKSSSKLETKLLKGRSIHPDDKKELSGLIKELWSEVEQEYDISSDVYIKERRKLLKINDSIISFLRKLDSARILPDELMENDAFIHLNELSMLVSNVIILMNNLDEPIQEDALTNIKKIEELSTGLINIIQDEFLSCSNSQNIIQFKKPDNNKIYQLKISLKYTKPPIWRRVLIPAEMELEDLHEIIQCVMGWHDCHLHHFIQGNTFYELSPEPMDGALFFINRFEKLDSSNIKVNDLLTREKQKIEYEYDFGDSWLHEITLEKIVDQEKNITYPVCIKGKRACPPEDCGGIPGYYSILDDSGFMDEETRDYYMEEIGDPEFFDINAVNARLQLWPQP